MHLPFLLVLTRMQLTYLKAANFRNFVQIEIKPAPGVNIFYGLNGSGKTNLLEAIFLLCLGRSQRGNADNVLLKKDEDTYRLEGVIQSTETSHEIAIAYLDRGRKQITIDGVKSRLPELYEHFSAVAIGPEDSEILSGAPSARRLFMDLYISQYSPKYLKQLTRYNRILAQKNAALKNQLEFDSYNSLMIETGSEIMRARFQFLQVLQKLSGEYYARFSAGSCLKLVYQPSAQRVSATEFDEKMVESEFENRLDEVKEKEKILKSALVGPHRDEIQLFINDLPARTHGSQGEWRSSAIALKLAVYNLLKEKRKFPPVLLLDEVFAELDNQRSEALINSFVDFGQLFLTTATEPPEQVRKNAKNFKIDNGLIEKVN